MRTTLFTACFLVASLFSCDGKSNHLAGDSASIPVAINRFDKELFHTIEAGDTAALLALEPRYAEMLDILGKAVLNVRDPQMPGFAGKAIRFYSEPTLKGLYRDAIARYDSIADIERALGQGFAYLKRAFPAMQIPAVYMHVSGFNQNVLVGDSLLSISIDKYLGEDYPLYQDFFYEPQRRKMCRGLVAPDYLSGWLMSEYPFNGKESVLLERMVYEGKIKYIVSRALDEPDPARLMGYTPEAIAWCERNEGEIWKAIIERKQLYTPDRLTTDLYFEETPSVFQENGAPGNIGTWIGWRIVERYMKETGATPEALMAENDAQAILAASKYKP